MSSTRRPDLAWTVAPCEDGWCFYDTLGQPSSDYATEELAQEALDNYADDYDRRTD